MALNYSKQLSKRVVQRSIDSIKDALSETISETINNASSVQSVNIVLAENSIMKCDNLFLTNVSNINISALSKADDDVVLELSDKVKNIIKDNLINETEQMNTGFGFGLFNISGTISSTFETSDQILRNSIKAKFRETIQQTDHNNQSIGLKVDIGAEYIGHDCTFQNISEMDILSNMFATHTVDAVLNLDSMSEIKEKFDNKNIQSNEGLNLNLVGGIFIVIVIVLIIIFVLKK